MKITVLLSIFFLLNTAGGSQVPIKISANLELIKISDNAYMHVSYASLPAYGRTSANGLVYINGRQAFLFDTPWNDSLTNELLSYLRNKMKLQIAGFIPNHWHEDCMGGLACVKNQKIKSYANQLTIEIAKNKSLPVPDQGFKDSLKLNLGDKSIFCYFLGPAHSMDNIVIWLPSEKILFAGCMCKSMESKNPGNVADGDMSEYARTIDRVMKKFRYAEVVIPGHGPSGGPELLSHTKSLIDNFK